MAALIFSLCGVLRLVRFNVTVSKAKNNVDQALEHKQHFTGLPIPAAAAAAVSLNLCLFPMISALISHYPIMQKHGFYLLR